MRIQTFGPVLPDALAQLRRCAEHASAAVLCADHHVGYAQPIGGAVAYPEHVSPSGVGYDIGCGNKAVLTDLLLGDVDVPTVMDRIAEEIGFGVGRPNPHPVDHPVLEAISTCDFRPQRDLIQLARAQLGTVGAGNHFVDLFADEADRIWVGVHFGSRGFGHRTAAMFMAMAQGKSAADRPDERMDAPPALIPSRTPLGEEYVRAMELAGAYAYAGRDLVVEKVREILGARVLDSVHNHHNFAWRERHFGEDVWVVRKGCTPAFPGQRGFVGASMGGVSVILEGVESPKSEQALYSTVHGAGRLMSRRQAAGRYRIAKGRRVSIEPGAVDWVSVRARLAAQGIEVRGGGPDEAPEVYRDLDEVLRHHEGTVRILHRLRPIGVAMAGEGVFDPYKD
ncbi:MAG: RtcB family protein [Fimbriimonadaceae bacterium]